MLDMVRWMMDLPMPTRITSSGGIFVDKASKANITDTVYELDRFPEDRTEKDPVALDPPCESLILDR